MCPCSLLSPFLAQARGVFVGQQTFSFRSEALLYSCLYQAVPLNLAARYHTEAYGSTRIHGHGRACATSEAATGRLYSTHHRSSCIAAPQFHKPHKTNSCTSRLLAAVFTNHGFSSTSLLTGGYDAVHSAFSSSETARSAKTPIHRSTRAWVSDVMEEGAMRRMDRNRLTIYFQSLTELFTVSFSTEAPAHQSPPLLRRSRALLATLDINLPAAAALLTERAAYLTTRDVPVRERMHAPVALHLISTAISAAPKPFCASLATYPSASSAIEALLTQCCQNRRFLSDSKFASMIFSSLTMLRSSGQWQRVVDRSIHTTYSFTRIRLVSQYDIVAVAQLCSLIAQSITHPDQAPPRPWACAINRATELAAAHTLNLRTAAAIANSLARVRQKDRAELQKSLVHAGKRAAEMPEAVIPSDVSLYLQAAAELKLPLPRRAAKALYFRAISRSQMCKLSYTMSMLFSLKQLGVKLGEAEQRKTNQQILKFLEGANLQDVSTFVEQAKQLDMKVGERFARAVTKTIVAVRSDTEDPSTRKQVERVVSDLKEMIVLSEATTGPEYMVVKNR